MEIFIFWIFFSIIVGWIASTKYRSGIGFFLLSILISPLLSLIIVLILPKNEEGILFAGEMEKCPFCKELVKIDALKCKHCGNNLSVDSELIHGIEKHKFATGIVSYNIRKDIFNWNELNTIILNQYSDMNIQIRNEKELLLSKNKEPNTYINIHIKLKNNDKHYVIETFGLNTPVFLLKQNNKDDVNNEDKITKLLDLSKLLEKGLLTKEEFEEQKRLLLK